MTREEGDVKTPDAPDLSQTRALTLKRLFRCIYFGPMVNFFVETCYDLEILSSNMDFAVISRHSNYCKILYFIFCAISQCLEKRFSDVRFCITRHTVKN